MVKTIYGSRFPAKYASDFFVLKKPVLQNKAEKQNFS